MTKILAIVVLLAGLALPPGTIDGGLRAMLITFFGLLSAGLLPAVSLLVSGTLSPSFSVKRLDELKISADALVRKLLQTLGLLVLGAVFLMVLEVGAPKIPNPVLWPVRFDIPAWVTDLPERILQSAVVFSFLVGLDRLRVAASSFKRVFLERYELARVESERRIKRNGEKLGRATEFFATSEDFGKQVDLEVTASSE